MKLTVFSCVCLLYIFFNEADFHIFTHCLIGLYGFLLLCFESTCVCMCMCIYIYMYIYIYDSGYKPFIRYIFCQYFSQSVASINFLNHTFKEKF